MKTPKQYYPILAAAAIAVGGFIPASMGGEKIPATNSAPSKVAQQDPVMVLLDQKLVAPLNAQASRYALMSRRMPTASTSYQLAKSDAKTPDGTREFKVMQVSTPYLKGATAVTKEYLKVRHIANTSEVLVALKDQWVAIEKHPLLKYLPKPKVGQKITP